jgi:hypothetical protein
LAPPRPSLEKCGREIPLGARLLKIALDLDELLTRGVPRSQAISLLESRVGDYDPDLLATLAAMVRAESALMVREVTIVDLAAGMVLAEDLFSDAGVLLLSKGNPITSALTRRLEATIMHGRTPKMIRVLVSKK